MRVAEIEFSLAQDDTTKVQHVQGSIMSIYWEDQRVVPPGNIDRKQNPTDSIRIFLKKRIKWNTVATFTNFQTSFTKFRQYQPLK